MSTKSHERHHGDGGGATRCMVPEQAAPHSATTTPDLALAALDEHQGPVIVDFDETLYLRNSTEDFLDTAAPRAAAKLVLYTLDVLKPWNFLGGPVSRDQYRIVLVSLLFPWTWLLWHQRARTLGQAFLNRHVAEKLAGRHDVTIASVGFTAIIAPLLRSMPFSRDQLLACNVLSSSDRRKGKRAMLEKKLGHKTVVRAVTITDSEIDRDLLDASARGILVRWPDAFYREAHADVYLPLAYLSKVKRPGQRYIWQGVIQEDFVFWLIATLPLATQPLLHVAALAFLLVSFWAVYEMGYVDNDRIAERHESDPKLTEAYLKRVVPTPTFLPWVWAAATGLIGLALLEGGVPPITALISWAGLLLTVHLTFITFNRLAKPKRPLLYPVLQAFRVAGVAAVAAVAPIAVGGLAAGIASAWIGYIVYRQSHGNAWPKLPLLTIRLVATLVFTAMLLAALPPTAFNLAVAIVLVGWSGLRARRELAELLGTPSLVTANVAQRTT